MTEDLRRMKVWLSFETRRTEFWSWGLEGVVVDIVIVVVIVIEIFAWWWWWWWWLEGREDGRMER